MEKKQEFIRKRKLKLENKSLKSVHRLHFFMKVMITTMNSRRINVKM